MRPSKKRVIAFMKTLAKALIRNFEDEIRNVIIRKPATAGWKTEKQLCFKDILWCIKKFGHCF
jgi:dipeptidase D